MSDDAIQVDVQADELSLTFGVGFEIGEERIHREEIHRGRAYRTIEEDP